MRPASWIGDVEVARPGPSPTPPRARRCPHAVARKEFAKDVIDLAIRKGLDTLLGKHEEGVRPLALERPVPVELLRPSRYGGGIDAGGLDEIVRGLLALSDHRQDWLRPVEDWVPDGRTTISTFSSLAHHLLADYPVPPVLLSAWFGGADWSARPKQSWFLHVGRGGSLRTAGFPVGLTRRMAHEFANAPSIFSIEYALRWAQVRGLGGSDTLARAVADTRLGREPSDDGFWVSVFRSSSTARRSAPARSGMSSNSSTMSDSNHDMSSSAGMPKSWLLPRNRASR